MTYHPLTNSSSSSSLNYSGMSNLTPLTASPRLECQSPLSSSPTHLFQAIAPGTTSTSSPKEQNTYTKLSIPRSESKKKSKSFIPLSTAVLVIPLQKCATLISPLHPKIQSCFETIESLNSLNLKVAELQRLIPKELVEESEERLYGKTDSEQLAEEIATHFEETSQKLDRLITRCRNPLGNKENEGFKSTLLPAVEAYLLAPHEINLRQAFDKDCCVFSKQSALRVAMIPLLNSCAIDFSKPLSDKSNVKLMQKLADAVKADIPLFSLTSMYRQCLIHLAGALKKQKMSTINLLSKNTYEILKSFLKHLKTSKDIKGSSEEAVIQHFCQEGAHALQKTIEALDRAIIEQFSNDISKKQGSQNHLAEISKTILLERKDHNLEANLGRAIKGGFLRLTSQRLFALMQFDPHADEKERVITMENNLHTLLDFLYSHLNCHPSDWLQPIASGSYQSENTLIKQFVAYYEELYQLWSTIVLQEDSPSIMKGKAQQGLDASYLYEGMSASWEDLSSKPDLKQIERMDLFLNQYPLFKVMILTGFFHQDFLKGLTSKVYELHKQLTDNPSSRPIRLNSVDDKTKEMRIEFKNGHVHFLGLWEGELDLDSACKIKTACSIQAPIHQLASCLTVSFELFITMPEHTLKADALQQLEEIKMLAHLMGVSIHTIA